MSSSHLRETSASSLRFSVYSYGAGDDGHPAIHACLHASSHGGCWHALARRSDELRSALEEAKGRGIAAPADDIVSAVAALSSAQLSTGYGKMESCEIGLPIYSYRKCVET